MPQNIPDFLTTRYPICFYCKHLLLMGTLESPGPGPEGLGLRGWRCYAYPNGIPFHILSQWSDETHDEVRPFQLLDYVYEPKTFEFEGKKYQMTVDGELIEIE